MAWLILAAAGLLEVVWAVALKQADGFTRLWPSALALAAASLSLFMLSLALRSLPVAAAYAAWVGIGIVGVALVGIAAQGESATPLRLGFILLIAVGIVGLRVADG